MNKSKPLVVIVDEEARDNLNRLNFRWFCRARERNDATYTIETPLGELTELRGTIVENPRLDTYAAEFLYLEVTPACQLNCAHCGVRKDALKTKEEVINDEVPYITEDFAVALQDNMKTYPYPYLKRAFFQGGGEPLISPKKFARLQEILDPLPQTNRVVTTNVLSLPLDIEQLAELMDEIKKPQIMASYSELHCRQYELLAKQGRFSEYIPEGEPSTALQRKISLLHHNFAKLGLNFTINVVEKFKEPFSRDLRESILQYGHHTAVREPHIIATIIDGIREPCSQGEEMAIRSNGRVYPHCYHIFNGQYYIGRMGLLVDKK